MESRRLFLWFYRGVILSAMVSKATRPSYDVASSWQHSMSYSSRYILIVLALVRSTTSWFRVSAAVLDSMEHSSGTVTVEISVTTAGVGGDSSNLSTRVSLNYLTASRRSAVTPLFSCSTLRVKRSKTLVYLTSYSAVRSGRLSLYASS